MVPDRSMCSVGPHTRDKVDFGTSVSDVVLRRLRGFHTSLRHRKGGGVDVQFGSILLAGRETFPEHFTFSSKVSLYVCDSRVHRLRSLRPGGTRRSCPLSSRNIGGPSYLCPGVFSTSCFGTNLSSVPPSGLWVFLTDPDVE